MVKNNYLGEKSKSLETRIAELKLRILDLERINSIHKALNASLRQELVEPPDNWKDTETFDGACMQEAVDIAHLVTKKQKDYGPANITTFGLEGVMIRLSDKINRLINLIQSNKNPENESLQDTFTDIAGYAIIGLMLQHDSFTKPLREWDVINEEDPDTETL